MEIRKGNTTNIFPRVGFEVMKMKVHKVQDGDRPLLKDIQDLGLLV